MESTEEIWIPIAQYPQYLVSNQGRVQSLYSHRTLKPWLDAHGYPMVRLCDALGKHKCKIHRLVAQAFIPNPDGKPFVDHKNGQPSDNRAINLRWCTPRENQLNRRGDRGSSSRFKGVSWNSKLQKWVVHSVVNGKAKHIGCFVDEIEAAKAYDEFVRKNHGEFRWVNFSAES